MTSLVDYSHRDGVATIQMDDGKNNLISPQMIKQLNAALDRAEAQNAVVVLTGRDEVFSAGFDLKILRSGAGQTMKMLIGGFQLSRRLLAFPTPVVIACNGHAIAMGAFLLLSGDYRLGTQGEYKIVANEVKIGLTLPYAATEICRQRLKPAFLDRATLLSQTFTAETAVDAGFLDEVVEKDVLMTRANSIAESYTELDLKAHYGTKMRLRHSALKAISRGIRADRWAFIKMGLKRLLRIG